jgi:hypothetical protein
MPHASKYIRYVQSAMGATPDREWLAVSLYSPQFTNPLMASSEAGRRQICETRASSMSGVTPFAYIADQVCWHWNATWDDGSKLKAPHVHEKLTAGHRSFCQDIEFSLRCALANELNDVLGD